MRRRRPTILIASTEVLPAQAVQALNLRAARDEGLDILVRDATGRAASRHLPQIDPGIARALTNGGRGERLLPSGPRRSGRRGQTRRGGGGNRRPRRQRRFLRRARRRGGRTGLRRLGRLVRRSRRGAFAFDLETNQGRADGDGVADIGAEPQDLAFDGRRNLDGRLVRHDGGEQRILAHEVADLDVPFDELGLRDAFADVGQLDDMLGHRHASIASRRARPSLAGPGK